MLTSRRDFFKGAAGAVLFLDGKKAFSADPLSVAPPLIVCSRGTQWGEKVLGPAWKTWEKTGSMMDAVERGANIVELDPEDRSVGYGGLPNEEGVVSLDSCVMHGPTHNCGAVAALEKIKRACSVARLVMERTDHMLLVGDGARRFALAHGFVEENLLTDKARLNWLKWKENLSEKDDWLPPKDDDYSYEAYQRPTGTINVLGVDAGGDVFGITTTSGLAFKIPGRVGDSPIIGAGLYLDNRVGAAGATGRGEEVIRTCGSFLAVELMRQGMHPQKACEEALKRIIDINKGNIDFNVKYIAVDKRGRVGCAQLKPYGETHCSFISDTGFRAIEAQVVS
jgi:N4-(beta-N-acetylglucosaminyl)-L-asparaginase